MTAIPPLDLLVYRLTESGKATLASPRGRLSPGFLRLLSYMDGRRNLHALCADMHDLGLSSGELHLWVRELQQQGLVEMAGTPMNALAGAETDPLSLLEEDNSFDRTVEQIELALKHEQPSADDHLLRTTARLMALESMPTTRAVTEHGFFALPSRTPGEGASMPAEFLVLIVEDDALQARVAQNIVAHEGYQTSWAEDGHELVSHLKAPRRPDLILMDVDLSGTEDGFDYLAKIRRHPGFNQTRVIMLTGRSEREDIARGVMLGANGYVTKPYKPELLRDAIRQTLNLGETA